MISARNPRREREAREKERRERKNSSSSSSSLFRLLLRFPSLFPPPTALSCSPSSSLEARAVSIIDDAEASRRAAHGDPVTTRAGPDCPAKVTPTLLSGSAFGPLPRSRSCSRRCCDLRIVRVQGLRDLAAWSSLLLLPPSPSSLSAATSASVDCLDHCFFLLSQAGFRLLL